MAKLTLSFGCSEVQDLVSTLKELTGEAGGEDTRKKKYNTETVNFTNASRKLQFLFEVF